MQFAHNGSNMGSIPFGLTINTSNITSVASRAGGDVGTTPPPIPSRVICSALCNNRTLFSASHRRWGGAHDLLGFSLRRPGDPRMPSALGARGCYIIYIKI